MEWEERGGVLFHAGTDRPVDARQYGWTPSADLQRKARMLGEVLRSEREPTPRWLRRRAAHCRRWHGRWRSDVDWSGDRPRVLCSRCRVWWVW